MARSKHPSFSGLAALGTEQWGLVTSAQAVGMGFTHQQLARWSNQGLLSRVDQGIYHVSAAPPTADDDLHAAWLALDPARTAQERRLSSDPIVVSHRSAAGQYGLGDLEADVHEFTASHRKQTRRQDISVHVAALAASDWQPVQGMPVTTPLRTILDLARSGTDGGHLASVVRDAISGDLVDTEQLEKELAHVARRYGHSDGTSLVQTFLAEAPLSASLRRADSLQTTSEFLDAFTKALPQVMVPPTSINLGLEKFASLVAVDELAAKAIAPILAQNKEFFVQLGKQISKSFPSPIPPISPNSEPEDEQ